MPSINEVWEQALQINANLATIHNDLLDVGTCCAGVNTRLDQVIAEAGESNAWLSEIRNLTANGFAAVTNGLAGVQARQDVLIRLAAIELEQNRSILCVLEHISQNTCAVLNESHEQTGFQERIGDAVEDMSHMTATVHPDAALELQRAKEQAAALEECCPPPEPEPPCTYAPCDQPKLPRLPKQEVTEPLKAARTKVRRVGGASSNKAVG